MNDLAKLLTEVTLLLAQKGVRTSTAKVIAETIRQLVHTDGQRVRRNLQKGMVSNIAWSGEGPLTYLAFLSDGLTSRAIATKKRLMLGRWRYDADYLPALATTRSEIIIPVLDAAGECVLGTVDVESEQPHAFDFSAQVRLEEFARLLRTFWIR
jgi:putative methionine-R-sulfoxide reductase with GAF domain